MSVRITLREAADFLQSHDNYLILSHRRPDGDTVGSCAALCRGLRALGKQAWVYANPQFTPRFAPYLDGLAGQPDFRAPHNDTEAGETGGRGSDPTQELCIVSCDVASRALLPFGMEEADVALALDHHGTNDGFAARTHTDERRAACGELILELLSLLGVRLSREIADALYVAISTDTGCFRYSNVTAATFRCAAACAEAGAEVFPINRAFFEIKRRPRLALEAWLVQHMEYFAEGRVALSAIPPELMEQLKLTEDDIDDISGFGRSIEGVEIAVMLRQVEGGKGKISLRTGTGFNAAEICARLGGGGHPGAAGASVPGGIPAAREAILAAIAKSLPL